MTSSLFRAIALRIASYSAAGRLGSCVEGDEEGFGSIELMMDLTPAKAFCPFVGGCVSCEISAEEEEVGAGRRI